MRKKTGAEKIIVLAMAGLLMVGWACSNKPTIQPIVTPPSLQDEAKQALQRIYVMELAYRQQYGFFWGQPFAVGSASDPAGFAPIGISFSSETRYTYTIWLPDTNSFTCTAVSGILDDDATTDEWVIDETGNLECTTNDLIF